MDVCREVDPAASVDENGTTVWCHLYAGDPARVAG
jgi:hypothetical protein